MIVKGAARSGPTQLGNYLMRMYASADLSEHTELLDLQSPWASVESAPDRDRAAWQLVQSFRDWQVLAEGTSQGRDGLYHAQISPAATYPMTTEQWLRAADILGEELGLQNQPRAVVLHGGEDRPHIHVVWSRTDLEEMKLHSDSYNYVAHERASKRMELEFGHEFVPGKHAKRDRDKQPEFPRQEYDQSEMLQAERTGVPIAERKEQITALRQASDGAQAFKAALEEQGYLLAKGDRGFVLVDAFGDIYSLSRQVKDMKPAAVREFMKPIDLESLPTVAEAKEIQQERQEEKKQAATAEKIDAPASEQLPSTGEKKTLSPAEIEAITKAVADRHAEDLRKWNEFHASEFGYREWQLETANQERAAALAADHKKDMDALKERLQLETSGLKGFIEAIQARWNPTVAAEKAAARRQQVEDLSRRQERERKDLLALREQSKQLELENLKEKQALKILDLGNKTGEDLERHIHEAEAARQLQVEIKEREGKREKELGRDGPEWPPPDLTK